MDALASEERVLVKKLCSEAHRLRRRKRLLAATAAGSVSLTLQRCS